MKPLREWVRALAEVELEHGLRLTQRQRRALLDDALAISGATMPEQLRQNVARNAGGKVLAERLRRWCGVYGGSQDRVGRPWGGGGYLPTADEQDILDHRSGR